MDANNKFLDTTGLTYFVSQLNGNVVRYDQEITDPTFSNENNIIIIWGSGNRTKCIAPSVVNYETKLLYIGLGVYYETPTSITYNTGSTTETVVYGSNTYTLVRTRTTNAVAWSNTYNTLNGNSLWNESSKRTSAQVTWIKTNPNDPGTVTGTYACTDSNVYGDPTVGTLSPSDQIAIQTGGNYVEFAPIYGYSS